LDKLDKNTILKILEEKKHSFSNEIKSAYRYLVEHLEKLFESVHRIFKQDLSCVFEGEDQESGKFIEITNLE